MAGARTIADVLAGARERILRYSPEAALSAVRDGAILIDTRSSDDIEREGRIPGSIYLHRNVLEWRCDPSSGYSDPRVSTRGARLIIVCNDGYASSLAAASLVELGFSNAGDLEGGFRNWANVGLPVESNYQNTTLRFARPPWLSRALAGIRRRVRKAFAD